MPSSPH